MNFLLDYIKCIKEFFYSYQFFVLSIVLAILLIVILRHSFKGIRDRKRTVLPYHLRDDFLSDAEFKFYVTLRHYIGDNVIICPKVNLNDIFFTTNIGSEKMSFVNKINRKHVDFLLCDTQTMQPLCGIELDDSSHDREDRIERDNFVDSVYESAGLPIIHVPLQNGYSAEDIELAIQDVIDFSWDTINDFDYDDEIYTTKSKKIPVCPKCHSSMIMKVHSRGELKGQSYFICSNYPKCKARVEIKK